jgi:dienelactone hydrolase
MALCNRYRGGIFYLSILILGLWIYSVSIMSCSPPASSDAENVMDRDKLELIVDSTIEPIFDSSSEADPREQIDDAGDHSDANITDLAPIDTEPRKIRASGPELALDPAQRGPYAVGVTTLRLTDPSRVDEKTKQARSMVIEIWYPAEEAARNMPFDAYDFMKDAPPAVQDKMKELNIQIPTMTQEAHRDAPLLREEGPYPVILFSHGSGGIRFQSVFQTPHLASHGYVVISADHEGNTLYDLIIDPDAQKTGGLVNAAINRPIDVVFMLEEIKKRHLDPNDRFYQMINSQKIGVTGHSFGGLTSILVTRDIEGLSVIMPQTPATTLIRTLGVKEQHLRDIPIMLMASKDDRTLDYEKESKWFYDLILTEPFFQADRYLVALERGGHFSYSDICRLDLKKYAKQLGFGNAEKILADGCAEHNTPTTEAHRIINHYATALFNLILRQSTPSLKYLQPLPSKEVSFVVNKPKN